MKRNAKKTVVVIALIALMAIPSMMAYFTDTDTATNTFTVGNVKIDLTEDKWVENSKIYPGAVIAKNPTVDVLENSDDAYVFVEVVLPAYEKEAGVYAPMFTYDATGWNQVGDDKLSDDKETITRVYAYNGVVAAGTTPVTLFEQVVVENDIVETDLAEEKEEIVVNAYAVQANGLAADVDSDAERWALVADLTPVAK